MAKLSRREWTTLATAAAASLELGQTEASAQQAARGTRNYFQEQRESIEKDVAELKKFDLSYSDEPIFRLVVR